MKNPLISIIVPVYKVEAYLETCIKSIVEQTYTNLEIILVDDGSPDNCPAICDEWAKKDSRIKVIHKKNGGPSDARNYGIEESTGYYITFIDSDDAVSPELIQKLLSAADNLAPQDIVAAEFLRFQSELPACSFCNNSQPEILQNNDLCRKRHGYFTHAVLFNRQQLMNIGLRFDTRLKNLEDVIFNGIYLIYTNKAYYIPEQLYFYRNTPNSITKNASNILYQMACWYSARNAISNWFSYNPTERIIIKKYRKLYRHCQNNLHAEAAIGKIPYDEYKQLYNNEQCIQLEHFPPLSFLEKTMLKFPRLYYRAYTLLFQAVHLIRK